jgi:fumarylacetoacetase
VAIGDFVLDLTALHNLGFLNGLGFPSSVLTEPTLNSFMKLERKHWRATRSRIHDLLAADSNDTRLRNDESLHPKTLIPFSNIIMHLPAHIGDYTDFYSSREHATNVGIMFRGVDNALQPNWLHLPVGYHGRASSVVISGSDVVRPCGQLQADAADPSKGSTYGPCRLLDFELEMAFFVGGQSNPLGRPLTMAEAEDRIFGVVVMNDWSARDIQAWEYVPLGPFTAKNFATSISPWIVTLDALDAFRCETSAGPAQSNPEPLPYLRDPNYAQSSYNVRLEVS